MPKIPQNLNIDIMNDAAFESSTNFRYSTSHDLNAAKTTVTVPLILNLFVMEIENSLIIPIPSSSGCNLTVTNSSDRKSSCSTFLHQGGAKVRLQTKGFIRY